MGDLFRNTLGPGSWLLMGLIPPAIFALYFLKLKRQPLEVPSTYLWHRVIEDLHVNSLWQKLRKSLLLFLQLLMLGLAILALLRPGWQGESLSGQRFIFLIDNSASMSATDASGGESRLVEAKQRVKALIDQMESDMSAMIISFAEQPDVVQEFTNNRRLLRDALKGIEPTAARTDLSGALELADGFANPGRVMSEDGGTEFEVTEQVDVQLYIFSDGRFPAVKEFSLGNLRPLFLPIGSFESENLAITTFNTRRSEERPELRQAFVKVTNFGKQDQVATVDLYLDGNLLDAVELEIPAGSSASSTFNLGGESQGELVARLGTDSDASDALSLDDEAYAVLEDQRSARALLVTPGNIALELALSTERSDRLAKVEKMDPATLSKPEYATIAQSEDFDLIIFDQCVPESMPLAHTVFIGRLPPIEEWKPAEEQEKLFAPQIIDWEKLHPVLNLVELGSVQIVDTLLAKPPQGGRVLIESSSGPLMAIAPRNRYEDLVLGFEIVGTDAQGSVTFNTDWPRKHSFPNFWFNVLEYFSRGLGDTSDHHAPENLVELRLPGQIGALDVELPDGTTREVELDGPGQLSFTETSQLGVYDVSDKGKLVKRFAVNLFDQEESDIRLRVTGEDEEGVQVVDSLSIGYVDVEAQSPRTPVRKELWKLLLIAALVVLMLEWYIYNRRVYV